MRTSHIAWIGAVLTFAVVLAVGLWTQRPEIASAPARRPISETPIRPQGDAQAIQLGDAPRAVAGASADPSMAEATPTGDPVEDGRAMLDAAQASADPGVRDEAAALTQALAGENAPQEP